MKLLVNLTFLLVNFCFPFEDKKESKTYIITHENTFDWNSKTKTFSNYTGWWPPEKTQMKGVEESILMVSEKSLEIRKYYHHAYCSELVQTFTIKRHSTQSKLSAEYIENGVYGNCDGEHEIYNGTATIKFNEVSFQDLLNGKVQNGSIITFLYYIPFKKEGVKMAIKIKAG